MTIYDLVSDGCQFEGWLKVIELKSEKVLFEGSGDEICYPYEEWANGDISYIYYDKFDGCMHIEIHEL